MGVVGRTLRSGIVVLASVVVALAQPAQAPLDRAAEKWIDETLKKHGGKYPGPLPFIKTMSGIKLDAVRGPVALDDRQTAINNIYIKKVEKKKMFGYEKDELWNTVIKTYPNVSQFWTYGKDKFLAQPVYDKNFPPCKFCE